jgi:hypothetical protein
MKHFCCDNMRKAMTGLTNHDRTDSLAKQDKQGIFFPMLPAIATTPWSPPDELPYVRFCPWCGAEYLDSIISVDRKNSFEPPD